MVRSPIPARTELVDERKFCTWPWVKWFEWLSGQLGTDIITTVINIINNYDYTTIVNNIVGAQPVDVGVTFNGAIDAAYTIIRHPFPFAVSLSANCAGSYLIVDTAPAGDLTFTLSKNGVSFGTATIAGGATSATFVATATNFVAGDVLRVVANGPDATAADIGGAIYGTREGSLGQGGGGGTVTLPIAESDVTGLVADLGNRLDMTAPQAANKLLAGPTAGAAAAPTFRLMAHADMPLLAAASSVVGKPGDAQIVAQVAHIYGFTFPANLVGSLGSVGANPTATAVYTVKKNGATVGTVSISTLGVFTFATSGATTVVFAANDRLTIEAPSPQDATLSDVIILLAARRN